MAVVRWFAGVVVSALVAAGLDLAKLLVARRYFVLNLSASYGDTPTGDWRFQLTLITWCTVAAALLGAVTAGVVIGALVCAGVAAVDRRALWRGLAAWIGWVWVAGALSAWWQLGDAHYGTDVYPLGSIRYPLNAFGTFSNDNDWHLEIDAGAVMLICGLLAWWSARRGERSPVLGAVSGPLLIIAVYLVGRPTQNQEYPAPEHVARWVFLTLLGWGVAGGAAWLAHRRGRQLAAS
jgi:hypothetical protein